MVVSDDTWRLKTINSQTGWLRSWSTCSLLYLTKDRAILLSPSLPNLLLRLVLSSFDVCMMVIHTAMKCLPSFPHILMLTPFTVNEINYIRSSAGGCRFQLVLFTCTMAGEISCGTSQNGTSLASCIATSMVPWRTMFCWFKFSLYKIFRPPKSNDG